MTAGITSLEAGRFRRLARRSSEIWQCGFRRFPMWIDDKDDPELPPTRAFGFVVRSVRTGMIHLGVAESRDPDAMAACALGTLYEFGVKWQKHLEGRPAAIHVDDPWLRDALEARRAELDADVVLFPALPDLSDVLRDIQRNSNGDDRPNWLDDPAITPAHVRSFAEAASRFYEAAPWQWLDNQDLLVIEHPKVPKSVSCVSVLGAGGEEFGLAFFEGQGQFERFISGRRPDRAFGVTFDPIDGMPFGDVDLWEDEALPVAGPDAYPMAAELRPHGAMRRPTVDELRVIEALLRAMAQVTEEQLDSGAWESEVQTFAGPLRLRLALPEVVEALAGTARSPSALGDRDRLQKRLASFLAEGEFGSIEAANAALQGALASGRFDPGSDPGPAAPSEQALQWAGRALEAQGRSRSALARRALALDPDCADAWLALAGAAATPEEAIERVRAAVAAGRRALGERAFTDATGSFWMVYDTRPFMRAMAELAHLLRDEGRVAEAIEVWQEMLRLNPNDNQGMRYVLFFALLSERRDVELTALIAHYKDDVDAAWRFGEALAAFSRAGATESAAALLARAHAANRHVLPYLTGRKMRPARLPDHYSIGQPDEAVYAASILDGAVAGITGCDEWIRSQAPALIRRKPKPGRRT